MQAGGVCDGCMVMGTPYFVTDIEGVSITPNIEFGFALGALRRPMRKVTTADSEVGRERGALPPRPLRPLRAPRLP